MYPEAYRVVSAAPLRLPHKCTAASSAKIAAQIDPAWKFAGSQPPGFWIRCRTRQLEHDVVTATGPKRIPAWYCGDDMMLLKCPYTGEVFIFRRSSGLGAAPRRVGLGQIDLTSAQSFFQNASNLPSELQSQYEQQLSQTQANQQSIQDNGMAALQNVAKNGWPADSNQAGAAALAIVEGGLVAAGQPELAAAVALLYSIAQAIAPVLQDLGLITTPGCTHTGSPAQASDVLSMWGWTPAGASPFAQVAVPMFAQNAANWFNCSQQVMLNEFMLQAIVALWNKGGSQSPQEVFVPALFGSAAMDVTGSTLQTASGTIFGPAPWQAATEAMAYAFQPTGQVPGNIITDNDSLASSALQGAMTSISVNEGPVSSPPLPSGDGSGYAGGEAPSGGAAPTTSSSGTTIAGGVLLAGGVGFGALALYARSRHETIMQAARGLLRR